MRALCADRRVGGFDSEFTAPSDRSLCPARSIPVMHPNAPPAPTQSWPTKAATLLFSGSLASLAVLHAGSPACSPASPSAPASSQPVAPVVSAPEVLPLAPKPAAPIPPQPSPMGANTPALNVPAPREVAASEEPAENAPPRRYIGGSKSAAVFEPQAAPQAQNNAEPRGAR